MTEAGVAKELNYSQEIARLQATFNEALFSGPGDKEFFTPRPDGQSMPPSAEVLKNETSLRRASNEMFSLIKELFSSPDQNPHTPMTAREFNKEEMTTFSHATLEKKQNPNEKTYPQPQFWVSEYGLVDIDKQSSPESWARRKDNTLASRRDEFLNAYTRAAENNTPAAADKREKVFKFVTQLSKIPIEIDSIQYQEVEEDGTFTPKIGIKMIRYLDGYQAFPFIHTGKSSTILYDKPLFPGKRVKIEEMGDTIELSLISAEEKQATDMNILFQALFSKIDFDSQK